MRVAEAVRFSSVQFVSTTGLACINYVLYCENNDAMLVNRTEFPISHHVVDVLCQRWFGCDSVYEWHPLQCIQRCPIIAVSLNVRREDGEWHHDSELFGKRYINSFDHHHYHHLFAQNNMTIKDSNNASGVQCGCRFNICPCPEWHKQL